MSSRKIFIDCGANNGSSVRYFKEKLDPKDEFEIFSFEPNGDFVSNFEKLKEKYEKLTYFQLAVSDYNGEVEFYKHSSNSAANTTSATKGQKRNCGSQVPGTVTKEVVKCIDLGAWIVQNFSMSDYIHLKLDVECAEYQIIEKMINDGSLEYVDFLSLEWHTHYCNKTISENKRYESIIRKMGIEIDNTWNTMGY